MLLKPTFMKQHQPLWPVSTVKCLGMWSQEGGLEEGWRGGQEWPLVGIELNLDLEGKADSRRLQAEGTVFRYRKDVRESSVMDEMAVNGIH